MKPSLELESDYRVTRALLLFGNPVAALRRSCFVTSHEVVQQNGETRLGPAALVTPETLVQVIRPFLPVTPVEILPEHVVARTADSIIWWSPCKTRRMYFKSVDANESVAALNAKEYPHPALLFKASGRTLWVRALPSNRRPSGDTQLYTAPYWNTYDNGVVCTGTMKIPQRKAVSAIYEWEESFFRSEFTHAAGVTRHTSYPLGLIPLWHKLCGKQRFPSKYLIAVNQTVKDLVVSNDRSYRNGAQRAAVRAPANP